MRLNNLFSEGDRRSRELERAASGGDEDAINALRDDRRRVDPLQAARDEWGQSSDYRRMIVALFESGEGTAAWSAIADVYESMLSEFRGRGLGNAFEGIQSLRTERSLSIVGDRIMRMLDHFGEMAAGDLRRRYGVTGIEAVENFEMTLYTLANAVRTHSLQDPVYNGKADNFVISKMMPYSRDGQSAFPDIIRRHAPEMPDKFYK